MLFLPGIQFSGGGVFRRHHRSCLPPESEGFWSQMDSVVVGLCGASEEMAGIVRSICPFSVSPMVASFSLFLDPNSVGTDALFLPWDAWMALPFLPMLLFLLNEVPIVLWVLLTLVAPY